MTKSRLQKLLVVASVSIAMLGAAAHAKKDEGSAKLPDAVASAFKGEFPNGEIVKMEAEKEDGVEIYDIEFRDGNSERECDIAADGTILNTAIVVDAKSVPGAAMKALIKAADGGTIGRTEKSEIRAEAKDGKVTKLDKAKYEFEAEIEKGDRRAEVTVAQDGTVVEGPKWTKKGTKGEQDRD